MASQQTVLWMQMLQIFYFKWEHNIASQQTVLWMRILDRLADDDPPKLIVVDPRVTYSAEKADIHLAPRVGTNVPLMNGILNLMINQTI